MSYWSIRTVYNSIHYLLTTSTEYIYYKYMRKVLLAIAAITVLTCSFVKTHHSLEALAAEPTVTRAQTKPAEVAQMKRADIATDSAKATHSAQMKQQNRCELATQYAQQAQKNHQENYASVTGRVQAKLETIVNGLTRRGIDTTQLQSKIAVFSEKAKTCGDAMGQLASVASGAKQNVCTDVNALKSELEKIKQSRELRFEACKDMKDYYQTEVKPVVESLRQQMRSQIIEIPTSQSTAPPSVQGVNTAIPLFSPEPTYQQTQSIINKLQ